jgi:acetoin utilization deacetylase AcuC-like enzyme
MPSVVATGGSMPSVIPFVWSADVLRHAPDAEVWVGRRTPGTEVPARAGTLRDALVAAGHPELPRARHPDDVLLSVHEPGLVDWLRTAAQVWEDGPYGELVGQHQVVPYVFPTPMMTAGMPWRYPTASHARAGVWCYDTMTLIGPGTWEAARAAVDCALTAVDLVVSGERAAYALTRPPGHHATAAGFGGSCYLNNAAVAARALNGHGRRVAVLDVDAHHGNGTQAIFWQDPHVFYGSVHVDPGAGWFPHVVGFADETGEGPGEGGTLNVPLPPGSGDEQWLDGVLAVAEAAVRFGVDALVVSLGVDAAGHDPESPLQVTEGGYAATGRLLATMGMPTVLVQEGGYHLPTLGGLVTAVLDAF